MRETNKKCSSLVITERQEKTTMRCYLTILRIWHILKRPPAGVREDMENEGPCYTVGGNINLYDYGKQ